MNTKIFISLPVADLSRSLAFWKALGYALNPQFSSESGACIIISEEIHVMVMTHDQFLKLSPKPVCDTARYNQALFCLSCDSRQKVDDLVAKAVAAGGKTFEAAEDHDSMYSHSFIDPDGHGWGLVHMKTPPPK
jgi:hypothetical protein